MIANIFQLTGALLTLLTILKVVGVDFWKEISTKREKEKEIENINKLFSDNEWLDKLIRKIDGEESYLKQVEERKEAKRKYIENYEFEIEMKEKYRGKWFGIFGAICISLGYILVFVNVSWISHVDILQHWYYRVPVFIVGTSLLLLFTFNLADKIALTSYWLSYFKYIRNREWENRGIISRILIYFSKI